jgi:hypothetical protein
MPAYDEIPEKFRSGESTWNTWQRKWFFEGLSNYPTPKEGIDLYAAMKHLRAIQISWDPRQQHKEAAVAYLASLWFEEE